MQTTLSPDSKRKYNPPTALSMATQGRYPQLPSPADFPSLISAAPAPPPYVNPPRTDPAPRFNLHPITDNSILGQPIRPQPKPFFGQPPLTDVDGSRPVISKRNQQCLKAIHCKATLKSKPNPSHSDRKATVHGFALQVSEHRPSLSRTILVPLSPLGWLIETLSETIEVRKISVPQRLSERYS